MLTADLHEIKQLTILGMEKTIYAILIFYLGVGFVSGRFGVQHFVWFRLQRLSVFGVGLMHNFLDAN